MKKGEKDKREAEKGRGERGERNRERINIETLRAKCWEIGVRDRREK